MFFHCSLGIFFGSMEKDSAVDLGEIGNPTVDGRNPAPVDMSNIRFFTGFYTSQVVQDFVHQL